MTPPPPDVVQAFGLQGTPQPISGGRGLCYIVGQTVFKPSDDDLLAQWVAELASKLSSRSPTAYRLAIPLSIVDEPEIYLFKGWTASSFVEGKPGINGHFEDIFKTSRAFHADLRELLEGKPRPALVGKHSNRWNEADRVVWGEKSLEDVENVNEEILLHFQPLLDKLAKKMKPLVGDRTPHQLIHGDLTGNILFEESGVVPPAIIDLTFYWRPLEYANAIIAADGLAWNGQGADLVRLYLADAQAELRIQLLLRALYWRALTFAIDTDLRWVMENLPKADYEGAVEIVCCFVEG
ncbi:phosphotransferase family protein [Leptodontidium sp. 2 PMI_412]|nr:phosphotransferase family protein [Leptodontidium sp. 2 PMI_412]